MEQTEQCIKKNQALLPFICIGRLYKRVFIHAIQREEGRRERKEDVYHLGYERRPPQRRVDDLQGQFSYGMLHLGSWESYTNSLQMAVNFTSCRLPVATQGTGGRQDPYIG
jgi:hypothetical protein